MYGVVCYGAIHQDYYYDKVQAKFGRLFGTKQEMAQEKNIDNEVNSDSGKDCKKQYKTNKLSDGDSREGGDFDLQKSPVSVPEGVKLFGELRTRRYRVAKDIERQCEEKCEAELRPCSILLQVEAMHHGAEWDPQSEQPAPPRSIEEGLKIRDQLGDRRCTGFTEAQRQCDKDCRSGLKPCRMMNRLEDMHKETDCLWAK